MITLTSRFLVVLGAATMIACSHESPTSPTDLRNATASLTSESPFAASSGQTLASVPILATFGVNAVGITSVHLFLGFPDVPIFDEVLRGNTHRMLVAGPSTPGFDTIVARLTDQVDDVMSFWSMLLPGGVGQLPGDTVRQSLLLPGVSLQGASIKRLRLKIEDLTIVSPGSDPNGDGSWTDYRLRATLFIEQ